MKHIAAVLLLALGEKEINEKNVNAVLASVGVKPNESCVKALVAACKGKTPEDLIKEGASQLTTLSVPSAGAAASAPAKQEEKKDDKKGKKEEKKKKEPEPEPEDDDLDIGGLF